jgi:ankyrin repeat protein
MRPLRFGVVLVCFLGWAGGSHAQTIFDAVREGDVAAVRRLLADDPSLAVAQDARRRTPLHYAASRGLTEIADALIGVGADVDAQEFELHTPLHWAAVSAEREMAELLVARGADLEINNDYNRTPLLLVARESGSAEVAAVLLDAGADVNAADRYGATSLELAAWRGYRSLVELLLDRGAALPTSGEGMRELTGYAVSKRLERLFGLLAARGADLDLPNANGGTLLHSAAEGGSESIARVLLEHGADVNARDRYGRAPLHYAAEYGRAEVVGFLIEHGAMLDVRSLAGYSPLNEATRRARPQVAALLRDAGASDAPAAFPVLTGPYLGQADPGTTPQLFAPDIVASHRFEHGTVTFAADGDLAVWETAYPAADSGYSMGTMVQSRVVDGRWTVPEPVPFSRPELGDDVPFFHPDGTRLFFISSRPDAEGGTGGERIWWVDRAGPGWGEPRLIPDGPNTMGMHWQFSVAANGNIYFSSGDPGGLGAGDIYVSRLVDGRYQAPENLGAPRNTEGDETQPYIAPDESYLVFGRPGDIGSLDLWVSFRSDGGEWTDPVNLGPTVNSPAPDICPIVSPNGRYLFFNSYRNGNADNHWVSAAIIEQLREKSVR